MLLELGARARCADGVVGEVADVVIDPPTRRLTHVAVKTPSKVTRLVPAELLATGIDSGREVTLACTSAELHAFEAINAFAYVPLGEAPPTDADSDIGVEDVVAMTYYEPSEFGEHVGDMDGNVSITYDRIPKGEAELRRSSDVTSADEHWLGHVDGLVVLGDSVTHIVLRHGHLWRKRTTRLPIDAVETISTDSVKVNLSKDEIHALPAERLHHLPFSS
jgi:hypothetical protein